MYWSYQFYRYYRQYLRPGDEKTISTVNFFLHAVWGSSVSVGVNNKIIANHLKVWQVYQPRVV